MKFYKHGDIQFWRTFFIFEFFINLIFFERFSFVDGRFQFKSDFFFFFLIPFKRARWNLRCVEIFFARNNGNIGVYVMIVLIWKTNFRYNKITGLRLRWNWFVWKVFREILCVFLGIFSKLSNFVPIENLIWPDGWMKSVRWYGYFDILIFRV